MKLMTWKPTDRDLKILQFVLRHRLLTFEVLHRLFFPNQPVDAVKSTLRRLTTQHRVLKAEPLDSHRVYYRLTKRAARLLGAADEVARPLGPQALVERYALLWFIALDRPERRTQFNPRNFPEQFDLGPHRLPRANFYIEETANGESRLGYVVVDHGGHMRRIVHKSIHVLLRFLQRGWFDDYFAAGRFTLTVLTLSMPKQYSLRFGLDNQIPQSLRIPLCRFETPHPLTHQVLVVPGLKELIPGPTRSDKTSNVNSSNAAVTTDQSLQAQS